MIVVDTNVVAYLLIDGSRTEACRKLLQQERTWCAPVLWRSEFRNVLSLHVRHAGMSLAGALRRMKAAEAILAGSEYSISSEPVLNLAARDAVSAYDAEFVCLADKLGTRLVTTDKSILRTFPNLALMPEAYVRSGGNS